MVILEFFREAIGEARHPAHLHPRREIEAFDVGRGDLLFVGVPSYRHLRGSRGRGRVITDTQVT